MQFVVRMITPIAVNACKDLVICFIFYEKNISSLQNNDLRACFIVQCPKHGNFIICKQLET